MKAARIFRVIVLGVLRVLGLTVIKTKHSVRALWHYRVWQKTNSVASRETAYGLAYHVGQLSPGEALPLVFLDVPALAKAWGEGNSRAVADPVHGEFRNIVHAISVILAWACVKGFLVYSAIGLGSVGLAFIDGGIVGIAGAALISSAAKAVAILKETRWFYAFSYRTWVFSGRELVCALPEVI